MIQYIHARLGRWGRVVGRGGLVRGLGYPSASPTMRLTPCGRFDTGVDEDSWEIDKCVQELDQDGRHLVALMYVQDLAWKNIARTLTVSETTVSNRLHRVHVRVMEMLNDRYAVLPEESA